MSFLETVANAKTYLQEHGRVSLRGLRREFDLDEDALEELVEELVDVQQVAAREGKVLLWVGPAAERESQPTAPERDPRSYPPRRTRPPAGFDVASLYRT